MDHWIIRPFEVTSCRKFFAKDSCANSSPLLWRTVELRGSRSTGQRHGHLEHLFDMIRKTRRLEHLFNKSAFSATTCWKEHRANTPTTTLLFSSVGTKTTLEEIIPPWDSACDHQLFARSFQNCCPYPTIMIFSMKNSPSSCLHVFGVAVQATEGGVPPPAPIEAQPLWEGRDVDRVRLLEVVQALPKDAPGAVGRGGPGTTSWTWWWMGSLEMGPKCKRKDQVG